MNSKFKFDIIFMDPPYRTGIEKEVLEALSHSQLLKDNTLIIVEAAMETNFDYLDELGYELVKTKKYKSNKHVFLRKK